MQQIFLMTVLATMVYAVAPELRIEDLRFVARRPPAVGARLAAQFVLLAPLWASHSCSIGRRQLWRR